MFPLGGASSRMSPDADWNSNPPPVPISSLPPSPVRPPPTPVPVPSSSRPTVALIPAAEASGVHGSGVGATIALVDYADDENAWSLEPEGGEMVADMLDERTGDTKLEACLAVNAAEKEPDACDSCQNMDTSIKVKEDDDLMKKFLPPPPATKCSQKLQEKIRRFVAVRNVNERGFNNRLRNKRAYRNPDFLQHAVQYQEINQMGTCFSKDVFDPEGYDESDYYDKIGH